ncbi:MAG: hypothetical protein O2948_04310 [Proteobacteria bacterium]|nr:hypothetical protein [Pseudomonadota bacterium]MDA0928839.1 hypothetical protein [Pseudomonadota bacterium]
MISLQTRLLLPLAYVFATSTVFGQLLDQDSPSYDSVTSTALSQLPELATPSTASGAATTAQFFGGASADNGLSFGNSFSSGQALDINGEIHVESAHIGTTGNLYLVSQVGEQLLFRDANGAYQPWDLNVATLQATTANTNLKAIEALTIVDDVALGQAGVSGVTLNIFFAYDTSAMPGELYYSGSPLVLSITEEVVVPSDPQSLTLFNANIHQQIIQADCIQCHVAGGAASITRLVYVGGTSSSVASLNYNTLLDFVQTAINASNVLISKPQGALAHGGGLRLVQGSASLNNWIEFVNALQVDAGN